SGRPCLESSDRAAAALRQAAAPMPAFHRQILLPRKIRSPSQQFPGDDRRARGAFAWCQHVWADLSCSSGFAVVAGKKSAEPAARKQQRLLTIISIGLDGSE